MGSSGRQKVAASGLALLAMTLVLLKIVIPPPRNDFAFFDEAASFFATPKRVTAVLCTAVDAGEHSGIFQRYRSASTAMPLP